MRANDPRTAENRDARDVALRSREVIGGSPGLQE
jgi:hypothetical protein